MSPAAAPFSSLQIAVNAVADTSGGRLDGIAGEVGVAGRRLNLGMTEQLADHRQPLAEGQGPRGEAVAKVVNAHVFEVGPGPDASPGVLKIGEMAAGLLPAITQGLSSSWGRDSSSRTAATCKAQAATPPSCRRRRLRRSHGWIRLAAPDQPETTAPERTCLQSPARTPRRRYRPNGTASTSSIRSSSVKRQMPMWPRRRSPFPSQSMLPEAPS